MNLVDKFCCDLFPEMLAEYSTPDLELASASGSYVFHEDYLVDFVCRQKDPELVARVVDYILYLRDDRNPYLRDLAQLGVVEGIINAQADQYVRPLIESVPEMVQAAGSRLKLGKFSL